MVVRYSYPQIFTPDLGKVNKGNLIFHLVLQFIFDHLFKKSGFFFVQILKLLTIYLIKMCIHQSPL